MNIAIIRLSALGDIVHSMVVLQFIKKHFPDANITWVTQKNFEDVLNFNPGIKQVVGIDIKKLKTKKSLKEFKKTAKFLKSLDSFDYVLDIQGLIKSATISFFLGKKRYGLEVGCIRESLASLFYTDRVIIPCENNVIYRNLDFVSKIFGFEYNDEEILKKEAYLFYDTSKDYSVINNFLEDKNILFIPGSSKENKNYPSEGFIEVAKSLKKNILLLWGNEEERKKAEYISQKSGAKVLPKLSLNDLKYLISKMDLIIGGDTGPVHMAWAMNRASIVLFGYTPVTLMYQTPKNIAIKSPSSAGACRFDKSDDSIKLIEPKKIIEKAKELLER
ncbi:lipopolysaccharide heptosyltransferase I [Nitrosophilus labii]|uniref:lipopolysaccharide heptosyltransferase I n=1 Tax=Nitrosophilus labii TaxID=2706014 RepID=UPI0016571721|nr:lipopolysaccharide heptosyltransferase I [Nitrosophilus labii]